LKRYGATGCFAFLANGIFHLFWVGLALFEIGIHDDWWNVLLV